MNARRSSQTSCHPCSRLSGVLRRNWRNLCGLSGCGHPRQAHGKHRTFPGSLATVTSPPIMRASLREGKAETGSAVAPGQRIGPGEVLEQLRLLLGCEADAGVGDRSRPSATWRTRRATSPLLVNLQALLKRLRKQCFSRINVTPVKQGSCIIRT
jgi:hypothetical protein